MLKMKKFNFQEIKETALIIVVMTVVLLPVRLLFVTYVGNSWIGSFGLVSAITFTFVFLAKRNKLGYFGRILIKHLFKVNRGKRRYFVYFNLIFFFTINLFFIIAVDQGNTVYLAGKAKVNEVLPDEQKTMEGLANDSAHLTPENVIQGMIAIPYFAIFHYDLFSVLMAIMNDISGGYFLHFSIITLAEQFELGIILIYVKFAVKKENI